MVQIFKKKYNLFTDYRSFHNLWKVYITFDNKMVLSKKHHVKHLRIANNMYFNQMHNIAPHTKLMKQIFNKNL